MFVWLSRISPWSVLVAKDTGLQAGRIQPGILLPTTALVNSDPEWHIAHLLPKVLNLAGRQAHDIQITQQEPVEGAPVGDQCRLVEHDGKTPEEGEIGFDLKTGWTEPLLPPCG